VEDRLSSFAVIPFRWGLSLFDRFLPYHSVIFNSRPAKVYRTTSKTRTRPRVGTPA